MLKELSERRFPYADYENHQESCNQCYIFEYFGEFQDIKTRSNPGGQENMQRHVSEQYIKYPERYFS